jgi:hypothetical protein
MKEEWMERQDEHFADSGLPIEEKRFTRRTALKVGGLSLAGAAVAWALPGRAKATDVTCNYNTACAGSTQCNSGGLGFGCRCQKIYYGRLKPANAPNYACTADGFCDDFATCPGGQRQCPAGTVCVADTCCGFAICQPLCTPTGVGPAPTNKHGMTTKGHV